MKNAALLQKHGKEKIYYIFFERLGDFSFRNYYTLKILLSQYFSNYVVFYFLSAENL